MSAANGETLVSAINRLLLLLDARGVSANEIVACIKPLIDDSEAKAVAAAVTALTCTHHNDQQRTECPVCLARELERELAKERARLDSGQILLTVSGERVWHSGVDLRAAIDAAMQEAAK